MAQTQREEIKEEIIEAESGYKLYREQHGVWLRLIKKYITPNQITVANIIEISNDDILRIRINKSLEGGWNEFTLLDIRLDSQSAEKVRNYMTHVRSLHQFNELEHFLLTARYKNVERCVVVSALASIESAKEPNF
jgi:hypothetical protein